MTWLVQAGPLIAQAQAILAGSPDPLTAGTALRRAHPGLTPERAAQVLDQAALRELARTRHGRPDADDLLLTRDGLEQGTRAAVAARRAELIRGCGARRVLDLTAGLGFDARALAQAGLEVTAIERDPDVAELLAWNLRHWPDARVVVADATSPAANDLIAELGGDDVMFVDPARRDPSRTGRDLATGRARPERDPERWSPPLSFLTSLGHPRIVLKSAPGFEPPPAWHAEWVSHGCTAVECCAWSWPAFAPSRRAVIMGDPALVIEPGAAAGRAPIVRALVHEPDPSIVRSGLTTRLGLEWLDEASTWLTSEAPAPEHLAPALRTYRVVAVLDGSSGDQRALLAQLGITRLIVKSRDVDTAPHDVLARLKVAEGGDHVLVLTRRDGRMLSLLTTPVPRSPESPAPESPWPES